MASPIPNSHSQFFDNRGNPIGNGTATYFYPGTTTPKPTWRDPALTIANTHPVTFDANGRAQVFGAGRYRQQLKLANGTLLFDGETALGEGDLPLATEIAGQRFDDETAVIASSGFTVPGKGAARYVRLTSAPAADEQTAGLGRWLFRSNGNTVWWRLAESQPSDFMFGVMADAVVDVIAGTMALSGTDDTAALQAAVDHTLYFSEGASRRLFLPTGMRRITNTIHLGYGERYLDWQIEGDARRGFDANAGYHSGIFADFNDRPALNIQGARSARLSEVAIFGLNHAWLAANGEAIADRAPKSAWRGSQMQPVTIDTRYAPYCGLAVDGYSGIQQPSSHYPDIAYPGWIGSLPQYDRAASSAITFSGVTCGGFEVGIAVQPNLMPIASNGDFIRWLDCNLGLNETGLSISHPDARSITLERCQFHLCHTALDSLSYGSGAGNIAAQLANCSFDHVYRMFNVDLGISAQSFSPALIITNGYGEAMYALGSVRSSTATGLAGAIRFIGGEYGFWLRSGEYSPAHYLTGGSEVTARFEDVSITGTYGIFSIDCRAADFSASFPTVAYLVFDQTNISGRRAASTMCGFDAPRLGHTSVRPFSTYGINAAYYGGLRSESHGWDFTAGGTAPSGMPIPLMARSIDFSGHHIPIAAAPTEVLDRAALPLSGLTQSGIEWTFGCAGAFLSDPVNPACCIGRGDVVRDETSGLLYYVRTVSFAGSGASLIVSLTLRQITGVRSTDGVTWAAATALSATSGVLRFRCARRVLAGARRRLAMTTTAGSGAATLVAIGPETFAPDELGPDYWTIATGDYIVPANSGAATLEDSIFAKAKIIGMGVSAGLPTGQLTFDSTARRGGIGPAPLFIKAS